MMAPLAVIQAIRDRPRSSCSSIAVNQVCICMMMMMMLPCSMYDDAVVCHKVCMMMLLSLIKYECMIMLSVT